MVDKVIRSRRKTCSLELTVTGQVIARVPLAFTDSHIKNFITDHSKWISKHRKKFAERVNLYPHYSFKSGDSFFYLGKAHKLCLSESATNQIEFVEGFITAPAHPEEIRERLSNWYRVEAASYLTSHVAQLAESFALKINKVKINSAKTRWGSCSRLGNLNFPWHLIMCPPEAIHYVVVHELAHLHEMNHSVRFWKHVERMYPDYQGAQRHLKDNAHKYRPF